MAFAKMIQVSVGLVCLCHVLLLVASLDSQTCEAVVPVDTTAQIGDKAGLKCRLSSQNIAWTFCSRDSGPRQIATNCQVVKAEAANYRLDKSNGGCNLIIDNVTASQLGTYNCQDLSLGDRGHNVELGNSDQNLALRKNAIQSSNYYTYLANMAVDGTADGNFVKNSCSCTNAIAPSWWAVDLGQETSVGRVRITNRGDAVPERLQQFFIGLTNVSPWTVTAPSVTANTSSICKYYYGFPPPGIPLDITCEPITKSGRYLFIYMLRAEYLTLCEVEAYYK